MKIEGDPKAISAAFVKARKEMGATVAKDAKGNYGKYATLAAIVEATTDVLAANGLAIIQEARADEQGLIVDTWLVHESGATMQFASLPMPLTNRTAQAVGSAITYARRYQLAAVCGLAPDDDDGQAATNAQDARRATQQRPALNGTAQPHHAAPRPTTPASEDDSNGDVLFGDGEDKIAKLHRQLHALGKELYNGKWDEVRARNVERVTKGRTSSSKELLPNEVQALIDGMQQVKAQREQKVAA